MLDFLGSDVDKFFNWVATAPPGILATVGVLLVGFALKRTKRFPNDMIPIFLMVVVGPCLFIMAKYGMARFYVEGMVCAGIVWLLHAQIWKRFAGRFFPGSVMEGFDTDEITKPPSQAG